MWPGRCQVTRECLSQWVLTPGATVQDLPSQKVSGDKDALCTGPSDALLLLQPIPWPGSMGLRTTSPKWHAVALAAPAGACTGALWSGRWGSRLMGRTVSPGRWLLSHIGPNSESSSLW